MRDVSVRIGKTRDPSLATSALCLIRLRNDVVTFITELQQQTNSSSSESSSDFSTFPLQKRLAYANRLIFCLDERFGRMGETSFGSQNRPLRVQRLQPALQSDVVHIALALDPRTRNVDEYG